MAARFLAGRDQVQPAGLECLLRKTGLGLVPLVVRGVDGGQRSWDALQSRGWIVVARGRPRMNEVVGVGAKRHREAIVDQLVALRARRRKLLIGQRSPV